MPNGLPERYHDQSAAGPARELGNRALHLGRFAHIDRTQLHAQGRGDALHRGQKSETGGIGGIGAQDRRARHTGIDLLKQLRPFRTRPVFERDEAGSIAAGPCQACDETGADRISYNFV